MRPGIGAAIAAEVDGTLTVGTPLTAMTCAVNSRQLTIEPANATANPVQRMSVVNGWACDALTGRAVLAVERAIAVMRGTTSEKGLVKAIPKHNRQQLCEATCRGMKKRGGVGTPCKPHQRMTQLMRRPLGAMMRMKAAYTEVVSKGLVLALWQDAVFPDGNVVGRATDPRARKLEHGTMLKMLEEQAVTFC